MVVPVSHCFGQNVVLLGALLAGASVRLFARFDAATVHDAITRGEVTMLLAAPAAFERLLALDDPAVLQRLRYALTAAAPPHRTLAARWEAAAGQPLAQGYGMTECSPFATYAAAADESSAVGAPIHGVDVRIAMPDGRPARAGEAGEIVIRGPNVMAGYWRRPEESARALRDGWLHTGDVGTMDADGILHLVSRLDDVINVAGFKAWPGDVERVLGEHPAVLEAGACGIPHDVRGAAVAVAAVLRPGAAATADELMRFASSRLAGFQRPALLRIVDALPRSASGKLLRRELTASLQRESQESPAYTDRPATGLPAPSR
jgi:long-chain acyl-CoA synthetase